METEGPPSRAPGQKEQMSPTLRYLLVGLCFVAILVSIFMCAFIGVFIRPWWSDEGYDAPVASMTVEGFENPYEGNNTTNGGGWVVTVTGLVGPDLELSHLTVLVGGTIPGGADYKELKEVSDTSADIAHHGENVSWYLMLGGDKARFMDNGTVTDLTVENAGDVDPGEFETIEGVGLIYFDNDNDGNLSINDTVLVFRDIDADGREDTIRWFNVILKARGAMVGEVRLG